MEPEAVTLHNQTASPLLRLPPEIRDRIYHFALICDGIVSIYPAPNGVDFCTESHSINGCTATRVTHQRPADLRPDVRLRSTCRQIKHEARNVYFACNTFAFLHSFHFGGADTFEDRHFKVPGINKIKTLSMIVGTCAPMDNFTRKPCLDRLLTRRIDDLKGLQALSKVLVRVSPCTEHLLPSFPLGFPPHHPALQSISVLSHKKPLTAEDILELVANEFKKAESCNPTVCLVKERVQERHFTKKKHDIRQWLDL
ncbi:uncharacterized protein M421DRAFT_2106 [Didymella exigua CBS 183.55]|uniref:DUF7730 domain-containing protein n=1 Tax=Didymella exigua CBS 183.55 TaxID=1150837 RepID=A0A6A5RZ28_9PLEO|nr:uncharacterized protein M421DRAFT_2106 [Didymella exigua CBS 183.55]KAF1932484.1 hypothetical protein M421DRAFT_2106 [Didymella exigua CBS 183.55]